MCVMCVPGVIEPNEFLGYFLLRALRGPFNPTAASLADTLVYARQSYIDNIAAAIQEFEQFLHT